MAFLRFTQVIGFSALFFWFPQTRAADHPLNHDVDHHFSPKSQLLMERKLLNQKLSDHHFEKEDLERLLQITYSLQEWPSFFGLAQYYRTHFEAQDWQIVYQLELLALLRHCQNKILFRLCEDLKRLRPQDENQISAIQNLAQLSFKEKSEIQGSPMKVGLWSGAKNLWPLDQSIEKLSSPLNLRIFVESKCD